MKIIKHGINTYFTEKGNNVSDAIKEILTLEKQKVTDVLNAALSKSNDAVTRDRVKSIMKELKVM